MLDQIRLKGTGATRSDFSLLSPPPSTLFRLASPRKRKSSTLFPPFPPFHFSLTTSHSKRQTGISKEQINTLAGPTRLSFLPSSFSFPFSFSSSVYPSPLYNAQALLEELYAIARRIAPRLLLPPPSSFFFFYFFPSFPPTAFSAYGREPTTASPP